MPLTSAFTRYGHLRFSSEPSHGESIYHHIAGLRGGDGVNVDLTPGTEEESKVYADAMAGARARYTLERSVNNRHPATATEMLPVLERDWVVTPASTDTLVDRRAAIAAAFLAPGGAALGPLNAALGALLGSNLLAVRPLTYAESRSWPAAPGLVGQFPADLSIPKKVFFLQSAIAPPSGPVQIQFSYARPGQDDGVRLHVGDSITVDVENDGLTETTTITSANGLLAAASFGSPHSAPNRSIGYPGASIIVGACPTWFSSKHMVLIVGSVAAVNDATTRRRVNEILRKSLRGPTQWAFVAASGSHTIGPFTVGQSSIGTAPIGTASF